MLDSSPRVLQHVFLSKEVQVPPQLELYGTFLSPQKFTLFGPNHSHTLCQTIHFAIFFPMPLLDEHLTLIVHLHLNPTISKVYFLQSIHDEQSTDKVKSLVDLFVS